MIVDISPITHYTYHRRFSTKITCYHQCDSIYLISGCSDLILSMDQKEKVIQLRSWSKTEWMSLQREESE